MISVIGNFCIVIWFFCLLYFLVVLLLTFNWTDKFFLVLFFYYFANILFVSAFCGNLNIINIDVQTSFSNLELISIWNIPANKIRLSLFLNINWVLYLLNLRHLWFIQKERLHQTIEFMNLELRSDWGQRFGSLKDIGIESIEREKSFREGL